ncbi:hypothetical protein [Dyadobacter sp. CY347]|uniref:hypothetical protein n=1 Tax=Dyadobacter sp. CY347 TaxID=2909336 RepID=UPI001F22B294|nr:hypothetical protein [Dyadobacter sp. CY347]MCF2486814.1 hypothetical protein [Dyadobacter sp. CY347]
MTTYIYKRLFVLSLAVLAAFGCADNQDDYLKKAERQYHFTKAVTEDDALFPTYSLAENGKITRELVKSERQLKERLTEMAPIQLPAENAPLTDDQKDGILRTYKSFLRSHREDALLIRHVRNRYARVILEDGDVINSDDYALIAFLTKELIDSKCGRFALIMEGINKVKGHVADNEYSLLVGDFKNQILTSLDLHKQAQAALPGLIQKVKDSPETTGELRKDFMIALYEKDDLSPRIEKLEKYLLEAERL